MNNGSQSFSRQDMTAIIIGFGLIAAITIFFAMKSASTDTTEPTEIAEAKKTETQNSFPTVSASEARMKVLQGKSRPVILDTRTSVEYRAAHIPDSISMPSDQIEAASLPDSPLLVITSEENQKEIGQIIARKSDSGFAFIEGGIDEWERIGGQIVTFGNPSSAIDASKVTLASADDFRKTIENKSSSLVVLDIRSSALFQKSRIPKARNIPLADIEKRRNELPPATSIALYGEDPIETFQAAVRLFDLGFYSVKTLNTKFSEWESKGNPTEK